MTSLGFENYAEALKIYLSKYRETQSARGENPNRPTSSYSSGEPQAGYATAEQGNNLMNPAGLEEQDTSAYGYPPMVQGHNGAGGESY